MYSHKNPSINVVTLDYDCQTQQKTQDDKIRQSEYFHTKKYCLVKGKAST